MLYISIALLTGCQTVVALHGLNLSTSNCNIMVNETGHCFTSEMIIGNMENQSLTNFNQLAVNQHTIPSIGVNSQLGQRISFNELGIDFSILNHYFDAEMRIKKMVKLIDQKTKNFKPVKGLFDKELNYLHKKLYISAESEKMIFNHAQILQKKYCGFEHIFIVNT